LVESQVPYGVVHQVCYLDMLQPCILTIQITMEERVERKVVLDGIAHHGSWNHYFMCNDEEDLEYSSLGKCSVVYILVHMLQTLLHLISLGIRPVGLIV
jgi:hypothetical protein